MITLFNKTINICDPTPTEISQFKHEQGNYDEFDMGGIVRDVIFDCLLPSSQV